MSVVLPRLKKALIVSCIAGLFALTLSACAAEAEPEPVGEWGKQVRETPHLALTDDSEVRGSDGCNQLSGTWTVEEATVTFGAMATTLIACPDVDTWLSALETAEVDGDTLTIFDKDGNKVGVLERQ